jgi:hypothetical protein
MSPSVANLSPKVCAGDSVGHLWSHMEPLLIDWDRPHDPELEVELELDDDDMLLDPWFLRSEAEIALLADDPDAQVHEIRIAAHSELFDLT